ncbi:hypothetical protein GCM10007301_36420 [Azorhizobium oxalatiphilum]|uniref:Uncharacterized protein n=1 Tax=Azorhizobium oxalatiphilum TaxID=980631 RepID=A0A917C6V4_9HYPH|nr:gamma-glutamylcyclotransferase family protein [Azorhizobium oxalatiphilum]GGF73346.1 hypothetical protein GCM10007301_36420 [Azorhizobium oxalatiphilum]
MLSRRDVLAGLVAAGAGAAGMRAASAQTGRAPEKPTEFLLGYGSLIDTASREGTAGTKLDAVPVRVSAAFGYRRVWNVRGRGWTALGLAKGEDLRPAAPINCVLFPVDADTLPRFDRRESGYDRVAVPNAMVESLSWLRLPEQGTLWIYVPKAGEKAPEPDAAHPIVQSYVDLVLGGALGYGEAFAREVIETTFGWSAFWLDDRVTARRPWVANPAAGAIDRLLARTPQSEAAFRERLYSEEYAVRRLMRPGDGLAPAPKPETARP